MKKRNQNSGSAMIVAMVTGVIVMTFCLSLLLVCYNLYAQTNKKTLQIQCKELAYSFSEELKTELETPDSETFTGSSEGLRNYLLHNIHEYENGNAGWECINSESIIGEDATIYDYNLSLELKENVGTLNAYSVLVDMYYEPNYDGEDPVADSYDVYARITCIRGGYRDYQVTTQDGKTNTFFESNDIDGSSFSVTRKYKLDNPNHTPVTP